MVRQAQTLLQAALTTVVARRRPVLLAVAFYLAYVTLRLLVRTVRFIHTYFLRRSIDPNTFGSWAVVTGATDGMGRALAHELAKKGEADKPLLCRLPLSTACCDLHPCCLPLAGLNIMLISRSAAKLRDCASELKEQYGVETRWVSADLCKAGPQTYTPIRAALESIEASPAALSGLATKRAVRVGSSP